MDNTNVISMEEYNRASFVFDHSLIELKTSSSPAHRPSPIIYVNIIQIFLTSSPVPVPAPDYNILFVRSGPWWFVLADN